MISMGAGKIRDIRESSLTVSDPGFQWWLLCGLADHSVFHCVCFFVCFNSKHEDNDRVVKTIR